ncbi:YeiH family protein [Gordonia hirsuta]|nr:putative sulfate exporter family transporter [Gordonia hirsuta]
MTATVDLLRSAALPWRRRPVRLPGLALVAAATAAAVGLHRWLPMVSPLLSAILLGIAVGNLAPPGPRYAPGFAVASRTLLRLGVALLGLQLVVGDVFGLGPGVIGLIVLTVVLSLAGSLWFGKFLGLSPAQRLLIACGTSICGAAAVAAADGVVDGEEEEAAAAIGVVVVFGTLLLGGIPLAVWLLGLSPQAGGLWAGISIHEVAQVVAAGGLIGSGALATAVVVKLGRVLMLAPVLVVLGVRQRRAHTGRTGARPPLVPLFVAGFAACVALGSSGVIPGPVLAGAAQVQTVLLAAAMFALGTGVRLATLRALGPRPILLGAAATVWISVLGLAGALLVG